MRSTRDEPDEFDDDADGPIETDATFQSQGSDDFDLVSCPYCRKSMSDLAEICPHCRSFISREDRPAEPRPLWVVVVTVLLLLALVLGVVSFR